MEGYIFHTNFTRTATDSATQPEEQTEQTQKKMNQKVTFKITNASDPRLPFRTYEIYSDLFSISVPE